MTEPIPFRTVIKYCVLFVVLLLLSGYVIFQARFLIMGPQVTLIGELPRHTNERTLTLRGQASNISHLWLNDRPIYTNENGYFEEALVLENGYTVATLRAKDRYGRTVSVSRSFVYTPASFISIH